MIRRATALLAVVCAFVATPLHAQVKPGDVISKDNANPVRTLVTPGNFVMVQQGMTMNIVPSEKLAAAAIPSATEKYPPRSSRTDGTLQGYVAGQPFPLLDPNDPQIATKIMNFSFGRCTRTTPPARGGSG